MIADAEADGLGTFFVGERVRVWISAGKRRTIAIPADRIFRRFGLDYVRVAGADGKPIDVVVQRDLSMLEAALCDVYPTIAVSIGPNASCDPASCDMMIIAPTNNSTARRRSRSAIDGKVSVPAKWRLANRTRSSFAARRCSAVT